MVDGHTIGRGISCGEDRVVNKAQHRRPYRDDGELLTASLRGANRALAGAGYRYAAGFAQFCQPVVANRIDIKARVTITLGDQAGVQVGANADLARRR
jgi:hypothetical protein